MTGSSIFNSGGSGASMLAPISTSCAEGFVALGVGEGGGSWSSSPSKHVINTSAASVTESDSLSRGSNQQENIAHNR